MSNYYICNKKSNDFTKFSTYEKAMEEKEKLLRLKKLKRKEIAYDNIYYQYDSYGIPNYDRNVIYFDMYESLSNPHTLKEIDDFTTGFESINDIISYYKSYGIISSIEEENLCIAYKCKNKIMNKKILLKEDKEYLSPSNIYKLLTSKALSMDTFDEKFYRKLCESSLFQTKEGVYIPYMKAPIYELEQGISNTYKMNSTFPMISAIDFFFESWVKNKKSQYTNTRELGLLLKEMNETKNKTEEFNLRLKNDK